MEKLFWIIGLVCVGCLLVAVGASAPWVLLLLGRLLLIFGGIVLAGFIIGLTWPFLLLGGCVWLMCAALG